MQNDETKKIKLARKLTYLGIFIIIFTLSIAFYIRASGVDKILVRVNDHSIQAEVADSNQERERGLCCRDNLDANSGMLFIYDQPGDYRFWMKDTRIPLDMYWISSDKKIVHIEKNVQPSSFPKKFGAGSIAQYVLETNTGFADKHNINIGDSVIF